MDSLFQPSVLVIDDSAHVHHLFERGFTLPQISWVGGFNLEDARHLYLKYKSSLRVICVDGCVDGDHVTLDSLDLIGLFKQDNFAGEIIAMSSSAFYRNLQVKAGCTRQAEKEQAVVLALNIANQKPLF